jgi:hypothetical protein
MLPTSARPAHRFVALAAALLAAVAIAGCSGAPTPDSAAPSATSTAVAGPPVAQLDAAGVSGAGLAAVAQLGQAHGNAPDVVALGTELTSAGQALVSVVTGLGSAAGVTVDTSAPGDFTNSLQELWSRIGTGFDPAWLKAVTDQAVKARAAASALLAAPGTSDETKATLRGWLAGMDAALGATSAAAAPAGATPPTSVEAGDGGQLAAATGSNPWPFAGLGLFAFGAVLLGVALHRRRTAN